MSFKNIKAVFLDIDNTLLDFNKCAEKSIIKAFKQNDLPIHQKVIEEFFIVNNHLWGLIEKGEWTREMLHKERFNILFSRVGIDYDGRKIEKCFLDNLYDTVVIIDGSNQIVEYLSSKYHLCTASNAPHDQQISRLKIAGFYPYIKNIFTSEQLKANKPSKQFFDGCFARLDGISPTECVMIGDSINADIMGGKQMGMKTINNSLPPKEQIYDYKVNSLLEIKNIL